jgi:hypothetical protein
LLVEPIEFYARGIGFDGFWNCFEHSLNFCWELITEFSREKKTDEASLNENETTIQQQLPPNYTTFRLQLLRLLLKLPVNIIKPEKRSKYLVSKFLRLYRLINFYIFKHIFNYREEFISVDEFVNDNLKTEIRQSDYNQSQARIPRSLNFHIRKHQTVGPLKAMLSLFGNFNNPREIYNEKEINEIYYEVEF